jgi:hypothetical protein
MTRLIPNGRGRNAGSNARFLGSWFVIWRIWNWEFQLASGGGRKGWSKKRSKPRAKIRKQQFPNGGGDEEGNAMFLDCRETASGVGAQE